RCTSLFSSFGFLEHKNHATPIYVINLLISDLLQLCSLIVWLVPHESGKLNDVFFYVYFLGEMASVGFMVCVALERYLVITHPLWYRFSRSIKISGVVCVVVWLLPLIYLIPFFLGVKRLIREIILGVYHMLPLPLFIFFLGGTLKALLAASRIPATEKRRILGILVLVLLNYLFLFMPSVIWSLIETTRKNKIFSYTSYVLLYCSPLADVFLYVFIRKGVVDNLLASLCCCKMDNGSVEATSAATV
uniref:G-protein coupled receptors family 1 profile domain-containing protein n=1 Tax=Sphaeramia orbicularis TaxID=375764 RepID=A0A672YQ13_9TELE